MAKKPTEKHKKLHRETELGWLLTNYSSTPIDDAISALQEAKDKGHQALYFEAEVSGYDGYLGEITWTACHESEETDEEFQARVTAWQEQERLSREDAKKRKAIRNERDRVEYERLQKKFKEKV